MEGMFRNFYISKNEWCIRQHLLKQTIMAIKKMLLLLLTVCAFVACDKENKTVALSQPQAPVIDAHDDIEITRENIKETTVFKWKAADFGYSAAITYKLFVSYRRGAPVLVGVNQAAGDSMTVILDDLNNAVLAAGADEGQATAMNFTLEASIGESYASVTSLRISVNVTSLASAPQALHLVGDMFDDAAGYPGNDYWNISNYKYVMFRDDNLSVNTYTALYRGNASFQLFLTSSLGDWANPGYGYGGEGKIVTPAPAYGNIAMGNASSGYYTLTVDLTNLTYSVAPYDASGAAVYPTMFISGDFNGWINENMTQSHYDPHIWILDDVELTAGGGVKFHADEGWAVNWGTDEFPFGKGVSNGANIVVGDAGKYFIKFNDLTGHYVFYKKQ
jgi:hypothetical protein